MRLGKPSRMAGSDARLLSGGRTWLVMALVLVSLVSFSCRRPIAPAPPPPAPAPPPPPPPVPTISITANPATINAGQSTTIAWTSQNANMVTIEPGIGAVAANGMQQVMPNQTVTYTARATGPGGNRDASVQVTVNVPPPPPPPPPPAPDPTIEELFERNMRPVYFDFDRSDIRQDQLQTLNTAVTFLQQYSQVNFTISGHADERGTQEYNIGLGDRRANSVRQFFLDRGIAAGRMNVISFGEERPVCTQQNEMCWQRNRRDEFEMR